MEKGLLHSLPSSGSDELPTGLSAPVPPFLNQNQLCHRRFPFPPGQCPNSRTITYTTYNPGPPVYLADSPPVTNLDMPAQPGAGLSSPCMPAPALHACCTPTLAAFTRMPPVFSSVSQPLAHSGLHHSFCGGCPVQGGCLAAHCPLFTMLVPPARPSTTSPDSAPHHLGTSIGPVRN